MRSKPRRPQSSNPRSHASSTPARRRALSTGLAAGVTSLFLPGQWSRPVIQSVLLPVHAQTSEVSDDPCGGENQPPTISEIPDQVESAGEVIGPLPFTVGDCETPADDLVVNATSSNQNVVSDGSIALAGTGANRTIVITLNFGPSGLATNIDVTVQDLDGGIANTVFEISVVP